MNKIESGEKLDFHNVLIRPKRTTLNSRSEVDLEREFKFPHSPQTLNCVPIMASNMDTVGTLEMNAALKNYNIITCTLLSLVSQKLEQHKKKQNFHFDNL